MTNPYFLVFFYSYKWLSKLNDKVEKSDLLFAMYSILFIAFIPHFFVILWLLKDLDIINFKVNIPKYIFGISFAMLFWLLNYLIFSLKDRYKKIVNRIENQKKISSILSFIILIFYFSIPIFLMLFKK
jgi:hypothetical protein